MKPRPGIRMAAWGIDSLLVGGLGGLLNGLGWAAGLAYWLLRDSLFEGQSIGKRVFNLRVVVGPAEARPSLKDSALRNLFWMIPILNALTALTGVYYLYKDPQGRHWGDRLADTKVIVANPTVVRS